MLTEDVKAQRRLGIAATDAAPIARMSPWKSPAEVWLEKKHPDKVEEKKSKFLEWGNKLEPVIADAYAEATGQVLELSPLLFNKRLPWLMCSPDRIIKGKTKGVECKAANGMHVYDWGAAGTDKVPSHYLIQCVHSMMVCNFDEWDLAVLIGGSDFRIYHLYRDMELMKALFEQENEFYKRFIIGKETPEFDWGKGLATFVQKKYPKADPEKEFSVDNNGDDVLKQALVELLEARNAQSAAEDIEAKNKTLIQAYMKECEVLVHKDKQLKITWKNLRERTSVDWLAVFHEMLPHSDLHGEVMRDIVKKHMELKPGGRTFRVYDRSAKKKEGGE